MKTVVTGVSSKTRDIFTIKVELMKPGKIGRSTICAHQEFLEIFFPPRLTICSLPTTEFYF